MAPLLWLGGGVPLISEAKDTAAEVAVRVLRAGVGAVPFAGGALAELVSVFWDRWQEQRVRAYVHEVAEQAASEAWAEELWQAPGRAELLARGLRAAMDADTEKKARALGRIAASGVSGRQPVDEARLLMTSLVRLEEPHVKVLVALAHPRPAGRGFPPGSQLHGQVPENLLEERIPTLGAMLGPVLTVLESEGMVFRHSETRYASPLHREEWSITKHGERLLSFLKEAEKCEAIVARRRNLRQGPSME